MTFANAMNGLVGLGVIGAWEIEKNGALFVRGVAEFEGDPDCWSITIPEK